MKSEAGPAQNEIEHTEQLFRRELRSALSEAWPKTTQELLPGYLPDKPTSELSREELASYQSAYRILGEMVKNDEAEVVFEEDCVTSPSNPVLAHETTARPKFKLKSHGGKKSRNKGVAWRGDFATDPGS